MSKFNSAEVAKHEKELVLQGFTSDTAFDLGCRIRSLVMSKFGPSPVVIHVYDGSTSNLLFACHAGPGASPSNLQWAERKRASVVHFKSSTAALNVKYPEGIPTKYGMDEGTYASHGGGFPLRVEGVEPLVGVAIVSGLAQTDDHGVIVEALQELIAEQQKASSKSV